MFDGGGGVHVYLMERDAKDEGGGMSREQLGVGGNGD
jgi:hypothetical protein